MNNEKDSVEIKFPTKAELSILVWNNFLQVQSIPGASAFNAAVFAAEAVIDEIKKINGVYQEDEQ
jgi:hypothetical protein